MCLVVATGIAWFVSDLASDLPDYDVLAKYEPPVTTRIHAADGQLVAEYARERRLYLPIQAVPDRVKAAFLSAEDKNFYDHSGLDYYGIARAVVQNLQAYGSGQRLVGAWARLRQDKLAKLFAFGFTTADPAAARRR